MFSSLQWVPHHCINMFTASFPAAFIFSEGLYSQNANAQHHKLNRSWTIKESSANDYKTLNRCLIFKEGPKNVLSMSIIGHPQPNPERSGFKTAVFWWNRLSYRSQERNPLARYGVWFGMCKKIFQIAVNQYWSRIIQQFLYTWHGGKNFTNDSPVIYNPQYLWPLKRQYYDSRYGWPSFKRIKYEL